MKVPSRTARIGASLAGLAGAAFATSLLAAAAHAAGSPKVEVAQAWSRPAAAGTNGAGFMTLANHAATAAVLTRVETPAARKVEIHRSATAGGMMSMQRQASVTIPAGGSVRFEPGGLHLMLIGLTRPLKTGDKVPGVLVFADGARVKADFSVSVAAPKSGGHMDHTAH